MAYSDRHLEYAKTNAPEREYGSKVRIKSVRSEGMGTEGKTQSRKARKTKKSAVLTILVIAVAAFLVLCRGVIITEKCNEIDKKKSELENTITTNQKMQLEIDKSLNLKNVEEIATNKLNMARPEKYQTIYIKIQQQDFVEKTNGSPDRINAFVDFFDTLKVYLD